MRRCFQRPGGVFRNTFQQSEITVPHCPARHRAAALPTEVSAATAAAAKVACATDAARAQRQPAPASACRQRPQTGGSRKTAAGQAISTDTIKHHTGVSGSCRRASAPPRLAQPRRCLCCSTLVILAAAAGAWVVAVGGWRWRACAGPRSTVARQWQAEVAPVGEDVVDRSPTSAEPAQRRVSSSVFGSVLLTPGRGTSSRVSRTARLRVSPPPPSPPATGPRPCAKPSPGLPRLSPSPSAKRAKQNGSPARLVLVVQAQGPAVRCVIRLLPGGSRAAGRCPSNRPRRRAPTTRRASSARARSSRRDHHAGEVAVEHPRSMQSSGRCRGEIPPAPPKSSSLIVRSADASAPLPYRSWQSPVTGARVGPKAARRAFTILRNQPAAAIQPDAVERLPRVAVRSRVSGVAASKHSRATSRP